MQHHPDDRFLQYVRKGDGCWEWSGRLDVHGYGVATRHPDHPSAGRGAHRIAWSMHSGAIPKGMAICHHCDNPRCVRLDHLFLGTRAENIVDAARKGRMKHKLTRENVAEVRALAARGIPNVTIAVMYGVTPPTISRIVHGVDRRHCDGVSAAPLPPMAPPMGDSFATEPSRPPPSVFWPRPEVDSVLVRIDRHVRPPVAVAPGLLFDVVKAAFGQRRKTVRNALAARWEVGRVDAAMAAAGVDPRARAETLGLDELDVVPRRRRDLLPGPRQHAAGRVDPDDAPRRADSLDEEREVRAG